MSNTEHPNPWQNLDSARTDGVVHYSILRLAPNAIAMAELRKMFPDGKANDLNAVLFSTSGVHGSYCLIEAVEEGLAHPERGEPRDVTFLIIHPRLVTLRYGECRPENADDIAFLKSLRASSHQALAEIGLPVTF